MRIRRMKTCHIENPLGFHMEKPVFSWVTDETESKRQTSARIEVGLDEGFKDVIFDSGLSESISSLAFTPEIKLEPKTRYFWRVTVNGDAGDSATSSAAWFETAKLDEVWQAEWISPDWEDFSVHPYFRKEIDITSGVVSARVYASGIGLYHLEINGEKIGNEYFAPHYNAYYQWTQYQTYDVTEHIKKGKNILGAMLGNGWSKGRFGLHDVIPAYKGPFSLIAELHVKYADGNEQIFCTDSMWRCAPSPIKESSIYDGELYDATAELKGWSDVGFDDSAWSAACVSKYEFGKLTARLSPPVVVKELLKPKEIIHTPAGETVIDMGQNMVGWLRFKVDLPTGAKITLTHGEVLQDDNFYTENLRTAKQEYHYISNGSVADVEPKFTFFGFRYVKLDGWTYEPCIEDFTGCVVYSDLELTGKIKTSNPSVDRLFLNALWGQKGNFLDVPTDCPQRDERQGWTGDAQVFCGTASFNMDSYAFYAKYLYDMYMEQITADGCVPNTVPSQRMGKPFYRPEDALPQGGTCAWADAATIMPWNIYTFTGDKDILERQYSGMKAWIDWAYRQGVDVKAGGGWLGGFHFGDWLALDGPDINGVLGGTENAFLAAAYFVYSAELTAKAARVLGKTDDAKKYSELANKIREDIQDEYYTRGGRGALKNQTFYVVSLFMNLVPDENREKLFAEFADRIAEDNYHLKTGFIGTPLLCRVLSGGGRSDIAYRLLLNEDFPSWLYAVKMGATTVWERWNSIDPDGRISSTGMNSLNHYSYGSIVEWMYRNMCGLNPVEDNPGFKAAVISPEISGKFDYAKAEVDTAAGLYKSGWELRPDGTVVVSVEIPFDAEAQLTLPRAAGMEVRGLGNGASEECGGDVCVSLLSGSYTIEYTPSITFLPHIDLDTPVNEILGNARGKEILLRAIPMLASPEALLYVRNSSINGMLSSSMLRVSIGNVDVSALEKELAEIRM